MLALIVALLVIVPLVEIYLLIQVGQLLGALPTVLLLLTMSVIGGVLLKREGTRTWQAFRTALGRQRLPATEVADGALVIFGGALLLTPGFATDLVGLLCVLPGSRGVVRRVLTGLLVKRLGLVGVAGAFAAERYSGRRDPRGSQVVEGHVVEGQVVEGQVVEGPFDDDDPPARR
jgi:UPF0716 protein FxsA